MKGHTALAAICTIALLSTASVATVAFAQTPGATAQADVGLGHLVAQGGGQGGIKPFQGDAQAQSVPPSTRPCKAPPPTSSR